CAFSPSDFQASKSLFSRNFRVSKGGSVEAGLEVENLVKTSWKSESGSSGNEEVQQKRSKTGASSTDVATKPSASSKPTRHKTAENKNKRTRRERELYRGVASDTVGCRQ